MEHFDESMAEAKIIVHKFELPPFDEDKDTNMEFSIWVDCLYLLEGDILSLLPDNYVMLVLLGPTEGADEDGYWKYQAKAITGIGSDSILPGDLLVKIGSTNALPSQADATGAILGYFSAFDGVIATDSPN